MTFYILSAKEGFERVYVDGDEKALTTLQMFSGKSLANSWNKIELCKESKSDNGAAFKETDLYGYSNIVPVLSNNAKECLAPIIKDKAEFLPIDCDGDELWMLNTINLIDAFDEEASELTKFSSGKILAISKYVLKNDKCQDNEIFGLSDVPHHYIFVSEKIKQIVEENDLKGFEFKEVELI